MRKFKLFGYRIAISREPFKTTPRNKRRNAKRNSARNLRLEMTGWKCEVCGSAIDKSCHIHRRLPCGEPDRNSVENIRVLCGKCWHELEKKPHILGYQQLDDTTRYVGEEGK